MQQKIGIWFPTIRTGTGTDTFTIELANQLNNAGFRAEITWLNHSAEYLPWLYCRPTPPQWAHIAHINSWLPNSLTPKNIPIITTIHNCTHDKELTQHKSPAKKLYHEQWIKHNELENFSISKKIIAVSFHSKKIAMETFGNIDIQVIHNGIETKDALPPKKRAPHKPFRLIHLGKWSIAKGSDMLTNVMGELGKNYELTNYGATPTTKTTSNAPPNIKFKGFEKNRNIIFESLKNSDCFIFPSLSEGLSLSMIEAQLHGLPCICSNRGSLPEIIEHEKNGLLHPAKNIASIINSVLKISTNIDLLNSMRIESYNNAIHNFPYTKQLNLYIEAYKSLLI